ncbi:MAG: ABC transporter substrate-binding protein [Vallitaleaceae bacterium]|jgi:branched-chain amino acid transport system substrate-binding protein|nr:ABC transporter substrate-binding protein [Vallitaleaceae bacterium]
MKKVLALVLVLVLTAALFAGCDKGPETVKIGLITPKTGDLAVYGIAVENAVILAVDKINADGGIDGKDIELIVYDNKADATESINVFNRLVDNDKIVALVGPVISSTSLAVAPLAEAAGIPMISPTATNLAVTPDYEYVFRACYTDPYQGAMVAKFANENLMATKAAILYNAGDDYSSGLATAFEGTFTGEVVAKEGYTADDVDFRSLLTSIKELGAEVVFVPDYYNTIGLIATQAREVGLEAVLLGGDGWDAVQSEYGDVTEGYFFANHYSTTDESPLVQGFITDYNAAYGETPNALAALGYDGILVMAAAIDAADSLEGADILAALKGTDMDAVTGHITFDANGDTEKSVSIIKITNGDLVLETKISK